MNRIEVQNISVSFKQKQEVIQAVSDVSFSVKSGEIFGIVGLSGAGKSTLIRTLNLLQRPSKGHILMNGIDMTSAKGQELKQVRKKVGMIFQHFCLIQNRTIAQNVEFALKAGDYPAQQRKQKVIELLKLVDLESKKDAYPNQLSGGQKQRVGIARALANDPEILLCDEATSALDIETTEEILTILEKINQTLGLTIVFITHELEVAKRLFHRMAVMEDGKIVEVGTTYDIFSNPKAALTKKLVGRYLNLTIPEQLKETLNEGILLELNYRGSETVEPLISVISKKYDVFISIIHGKIEYISHQAIGKLFIYVTGSLEQRTLAVAELKEKVALLKEI